MHEPDAVLPGEIQAQRGLHELMIEDANQAHQRAELDIYDSVLFIVLRTAQLDMRELEWSFGYPASLLLMLAICRTLYYRFRRAAWL